MLFNYRSRYENICVARFSFPLSTIRLADGGLYSKQSDIFAHRIESLIFFGEIMISSSCSFDDDDDDEDSFVRQIEMYFSVQKLKKQILYIALAKDLTTISSSTVLVISNRRLKNMMRLSIIIMMFVMIIIILFPSW